ncbi:MAG: hypothetical protein NC200_02005 [Candidatus Gastranaerophilales bacterium]|nr:hypothetical protein [Candidatus Gastranaerophilales bacterium]
MNFNKDLIHNLEGQNVSRTIREAKNVVGKIADELAPGTSKDISNGVKAEDALGRASFSMMNRLPQFKLQEKLTNICEELGNPNSYGVSRLREICTTNNELNQDLILTSEEFIKLAKAKPVSQQYCWDTYFPDLIQGIKNTDGTINKDIYDSTKMLLEDSQISTRGIPDIINGATEWHKNEHGEFVKSFNKGILNKYRSFMDLNKIMHEQDDVFTLYLGRTLNGCRMGNKWLREGQEQIVDEVAFNLAKRMYKQGEDILHMDYFLENFHKYANENGNHVVSGFNFTPKNPERWATKMIEDLVASCDVKLAEACKVNGEHNLHNLLVADTLKQETCMYPWNITHIIEKLKDENGLVPTDMVSYICKKGKDASICDTDIQKCLRKNGSVDGHIWRKLQNEDFYADDLVHCRVNGEINYDNVDVLQALRSKIKEQGKYEHYHIREVFGELKNKDGVVDKALLEPLDELIQYTHLAPKELKDCLNAKGEVDKALLDFKKDILKRNGYYNATLPDICKNSDGTANLRGINAVKSMMDNGLNNNQVVINTFKSEKGYDYQALQEFVQEYSSTDSRYADKILNMSITGEYQPGKDIRTIDLKTFRTLKDAMSKPEIAPLMEDSTNAAIVRMKMTPMKLLESNSLNDNCQLYSFEHLKPQDVEILDRNGYSARFYKELGRVQKYFVDTTSDSVKSFEQNFVSGSALENKLAGISLKGDISLAYSTEQLSSDIKKVLDKLPESDKATLSRAFRLEFSSKGAVEGFPQRFALDTTPPTGMEEAFSSINSAINKFYSTGVKSDNPELAQLSDEIISGFPEFKMLIGKTSKTGERVDIKTLEQLKKLTTSPEYKALSEEDKSVAKMTVLLNNLEHVNSKPSLIQKSYMSDNDGLAVHIDAGWKKQAEYANSILERYSLSEQAKYRTTQLINDIGWSKELEAGTLSPFDIAVNQRYKGDEIVSPLVEKIVQGECKFDKAAVAKEVQNIRKNQQLFMTPTMAELEPYIQTTKINGRELRYVDLDRPELQDKAFLAHFLGYDNFDHTLNILKNRAYRSAFSASVVKGGEHSSCFAGRNTGIVFEPDNVNIALISDSNIDSGFGKQYSHLKQALKNGGEQDIKYTMRKELNLSDEEYAQLMAQTVHSTRETLPDVVINGRRISKEEIKKAHDKGIEEILSSRDQNETTVLNPKPFAIMGIGENLNAYEVNDAVSMAQNNDMVMLFKRRLS